MNSPGHVQRVIAALNLARPGNESKGQVIAHSEVLDIDVPVHAANLLRH
jgi:hypothetical protein